MSGKGGVGKTTISAALIKFFLNSGYKVIAVDADPDVSLGLVLGIENNLVHDLRPIVEMREIIKEKCGDGAFFPLNPQVDDILEKYSIKIGQLSFLKMGAVKQGGSNCYCRENTVLNALINALVVNENEIVLLDMGAGIEHLTRGTTYGVDLMIIVSEATQTSVNTALTVKKLACEIGISEIKYIGNKIRNQKDIDFLIKTLPAQDILGFVGYNEKVMELAMEILPLENSSAAAIDLSTIWKKILAKTVRPNV